MPRSWRGYGRYGKQGRADGSAAVARGDDTWRDQAQKEGPALTRAPAPSGSLAMSRPPQASEPPLRRQQGGQVLAGRERARLGPGSWAGTTR